MKFKKIHIVGIYGSGKSTLAKALSEKLKIKSYDLDEIKYKRKYDLIRPVEERLKIVKDISNKKSWITEGAWLDYALPLYKKADLAIFLEIPKNTLQKRIFFRYIKRRFHKQKYLNNTLKTTLKIMDKVKKYYHDPTTFITHSKHKEYLDKYAKKVFVIKKKSDLPKLFEFLEIKNP